MNRLLANNSFGIIKTSLQTKPRISTNANSFSAKTTSSSSHINTQLKKQPVVYIVDFLNIFSDFREIKYKKENIDFHSVKHSNKEQDTYDFFKLFFSKYIDYVNIDRSSQFYFVMKKLNDYEVILDNIMKRHYDFNMKFIIIEDKYDNFILDKNKDDFLCQYFFYILQKKNKCVLISNDKYRDKGSYIKLFNFDIFIRVVNYNKSTKTLEKSTLKIRLTDSVSNNMILQKYTRCTIPKRDLNQIL
jgi:hypothetical protein